MKKGEQPTILSDEIRTLVSDINKIISKKDDIRESIKNRYLCFSTNN